MAKGPYVPMGNSQVIKMEDGTNVDTVTGEIIEDHNIRSLINVSQLPDEGGGDFLPGIGDSQYEPMDFSQLPRGERSKAGKGVEE